MPGEGTGRTAFGRVVLVRHGQSRATVDGVAGGARGCQGLTDLGRTQVTALARRLASTGELGRVDALVSSTLQRAVETAELLRPVFGGVPVVRDAGVCEMDPGEGDGLRWEDWAARYGTFDVAAEPFRELSPGGESWASFGLRAGAALTWIAREHAGRTVVVACHGGIVEQSVILGLGLAAQTPPGWRVGTPMNASMTEWRVDVADGRPPHWTLVRFADAAHLDADGVPREVRWA